MALSWTTLSTGKLAAELTPGGHPVASDTVAKLLKDNGYRTLLFKTKLASRGKLLNKNAGNTVKVTLPAVALSLI